MKFKTKVAALSAGVAIAGIVGVATAVFAHPAVGPPAGGQCAAAGWGWAPVAGTAAT